MRSADFAMILTLCAMKDSLATGTVIRHVDELASFRTGFTLTAMIIHTSAELVILPYHGERGAAPSLPLGQEIMA